MPTTWDARPSTPSAPLLVCLALTFASISCNDSTGPDAGGNGLALSRTDIALVPGGHFQLEARPAGSEAEGLLDEGVEWSSLNPAVATIDSDGLVTAVAEGTTEITASVDDRRGTAEVRVVILSFRAVTAGQFHACGLTPEEEAWCWGRGPALGDSIGQPTDLPVRVAGGHRFRQIATSYRHTCALTVDDRVYCWGQGPLGITGECSAGQCTSPDSSLVPVEVAADLRFASIDVKSSLACGVTTEADAYCWGDGSATGLGSDTPVRVEGDLDFAAISAGFAHACGLTTDGHVYCWGRNGDGALGTADDRLESETPVRATALGDGFFTAVLATDDDVTCAVREDGVLLCFGENAFGQLGRGFRSDGERSPETPTGLGPVSSVTGGLLHLCATAADGTAHCWGSSSGFHGELGHGQFSNSDAPVQVAEIANFARVDAAITASTCGVTTDRVAYCWGRIQGTDDEARANVPTRVPGQR